MNLRLLVLACVSLSVSACGSLVAAHLDGAVSLELSFCAVTSGHSATSRSTHAVPSRTSHGRHIILLCAGDKHDFNTTVLEETKTARGRKLVGRRGTIDTVEEPPVFLNVYSGHAQLEFIEPIQRVFATFLAHSSRKIFIFIDAVDLRSYDPEFRQQWVTWVDKHHAQIGGLYVLVRSKLVEMGINLARVALGPMLHAYSDRAEFERVYQQCKRDGA